MFDDDSSTSIESPYEGGNPPTFSDVAKGFFCAVIFGIVVTVLVLVILINNKADELVEKSSGFRNRFTPRSSTVTKTPFNGRRSRTTPRQRDVSTFRGRRSAMSNNCGSDITNYLHGSYRPTTGSDNVTGASSLFDETKVQSTFLGGRDPASVYRGLSHADVMASRKKGSEGFRTRARSHNKNKINERAMHQAMSGR